MHLLGEAAASLLAGWVPALGQLLLVLALGVVAYVPGRGVVDLVWPPPPAGGGGGPRGGLEDAAVSASLGLVLFATGGFLLGLAGALGAWSFAALVLVAHLAAHRVWRRIAASLPSVFPPTTAVLGASLFALPLVALALISLYPPHLFDSTAYHLPYTQGFLATGDLPVLPDLIYPVFPQLAEMLWVPVLPPFGASGAHAVVLLHGLLAGAAAYAWGRRLEGRRLEGRRLEGRRAGAFAAALWLGCPGVVLYATVAYVDVVVAHFVAAAGLAAWVGWRRRWDGRWLAIAGALAGAAAAVKYHGLVLALLGFAAMAVAAVVARKSAVAPGRRWRAVALYLLLAGAVAAPWYLRIHLATGSPLHPFVEGRAGTGVEVQAAAVPHRSPPPPPPALSRWGAKLVTAVVRDLDDVPRLIREETLVGFKDHGPPLFAFWFLALVPLAALPSLRRPGTAVVLAVVAVYCAFWFVTARDPRYLFYPAILVCPVAGVVAERLLAALPRRRRPGFGVGVAVALLLAAPGTLYAGFRLASLGPLPRTPAAVELFLTPRVPGYKALTTLQQKAVQETGGRVTVYAVGGQRLHAFATGRLLAPVGHRLPASGAGGLAAALRGEGVELVLVVHGVEGRSGSGETRAARIARRLAATPGIRFHSRVATTDVFAVEESPRTE